jgi:hypothetical protein
MPDKNQLQNRGSYCNLLLPDKINSFKIIVNVIRLNKYATEDH